MVTNVSDTEMELRLELLLMGNTVELLYISSLIYAFCIWLALVEISYLTQYRSHLLFNFISYSRNVTVGKVPMYAKESVRIENFLFQSVASD